MSVSEIFKIIEVDSVDLGTGLVPVLSGNSKEKYKVVHNGDVIAYCILKEHAGSLKAWLDLRELNAVLKERNDLGFKILNRNKGWVATAFYASVCDQLNEIANPRPSEDSAVDPKVTRSS